MMTLARIVAALELHDVRDVAERIAREHRLSLADMFDRGDVGRSRRPSDARAAFYRYLRDVDPGPWSLSSIGRLVGLDPSTVRYALVHREVRPVRDATRALEDGRVFVVRMGKRSTP